MRSRLPNYNMYSIQKRSWKPKPTDNIDTLRQYIHHQSQIIHTAFSTLTQPSSVGSAISLVTMLYRSASLSWCGHTSGTHLSMKEYNPTPLPTFHTLGSLLHHGAFSIVNTSNTALCNSLTFPPLTCLRARSATF